MRTPRGRPDLRLAESYLPAALTLGKGLGYTCALCVLTKWVTKWGWVPPLMLLYYDHMFWPLSCHAFAFLDSTSICVDVVAGTMLSLMMRGGEGLVMMQGIALVVWSVLGACHILLWSQQHEHVVLTRLGNMVVITAGVGSVLFASPQAAEGVLVVSAFVFRSTVYLLLVMIDAYTLRGPTQRERDKVGALRYGAILLAPSLTWVLVCCVCSVLAQAVRLFYLSDNTHPPSEPDAKGSKPQHLSLKNAEEGKASNYFAAYHTTTAPMSSAVDSLDINEAFRLAKLQYKDAKSNH